MDKVVCYFQEVLLFPHTFAASLTAVITCVLCALGSCSAILGNSLVIAAFCRNKDLQTISNCFLISLTCTDLLVGGVVEPLYIARQSLALSGTDHCGVWVAYLTMALFCTGASFLNVALISCERYMAIFWPFFYARTATKCRVIAVVGTLWVSWILLTAVRFLGVANRTIYMIVFAIIGSSLAGTAFIYVRIFREARRHQKVIATQQSCDGSSTAKEAKLAKTVVLVFGALLLCYTPGMIILLMRTIRGDTPALLYVAYPWAEASIFMNSTLNPLIYCWRNRDIRSAVFRVISPFKRRVSPEPAFVTNVASIMNYSNMKTATPTSKIVCDDEKFDLDYKAGDAELQSISSKM